MSFANFGIGLGAFADGLNKGMDVGQRIIDVRNKRKVADTYKEGLASAKARREEDVSKAVQVGSKASADNTMTLPDYQVDGKSYASEDEARGAADKSVASVMDYFYQNEAPRIAELYMAQGDPEKAQVWETWVKDKNTKKGFEYGVRALQLASSGDDQGAINNMIKMYNHPGYFDDGRKATGVTPIKAEDGSTVGYDIAIEAADGSTTSLSVGTGEQLLKQIQMFASPQAVYDQGMAEVRAAKDAQLAAAKGELDHSRALEVAQVKANNQQQLAQQQGTIQLRNGIALDNAKQANRVALEQVKSQAGLAFKKGASPTEAARQMAMQLRKLTDLQGNPVYTNEGAMAEAEEFVTQLYSQEAIANDAGFKNGSQQPVQPRPQGPQPPQGVPVFDSATGKIVYR